MMQWWTPDAVRFMRDASEYGAHYTLLSEYLMRWLPADGHVCDAGSGLGYLAQALAAHCRRRSTAPRRQARLRLQEIYPAICGSIVMMSLRCIPIRFMMQ